MDALSADSNPSPSIRRVTDPYVTATESGAILWATNSARTKLFTFIKTPTGFSQSDVFYSAGEDRTLYSPSVVSDGENQAVYFLDVGENDTRLLRTVVGQESDGQHIHVTLCEDPC